MIIILICAGNYQEYIVQNIEQLIKLDYNIHVIIDKSFRKKLKRYKRLIKISFTEELETDFDKKSKLNKTFRGGLAHFTSKRLFLLYRYMKKNNIENVIHLENDVLLYSKMDFNFDKTKIYLTMHSEVNCIPGIMYIPKFKLLKNLIKNYDYSRDHID